MVHPSESKSRRWKSANTPDTSAPSAARTPSRDTRSEFGNARVARRRLPEAHGLFRKSRAGYKERSTQKPDRSHQDSRCCRHEIDHPTTERNRGGVKYECMGMELFYSRRKAFMSGWGNNQVFQRRSTRAGQSASSYRMPSLSYDPKRRIDRLRSNDRMRENPSPFPNVRFLPLPLAS